MAKAMKLAIGIVLLLTVVNGKYRCNKSIKKVERCLANGYKAKLLNNCVTGEGSVAQRRCEKLESKVVNKCGFQCETVQPTDGDWIPIRYDNVPPSTNDEGSTVYKMTSEPVPFTPADGQAVRFYLRFTLKKPIDKYLYNSFSVNLYDESGNKLVSLNFIYYFYSNEETGSLDISGYERFYLFHSSRGRCYKAELIDALPGVDHTMTVDVGSPTMYSTTTPDGSTKSLDMSTCSDYNDYMENGLIPASSAELVSVVQTNDYSDYVGLEYKFEVYNVE